MFLSIKKCGGKGECIKACPTEAIRMVKGKSFSCICCGACAEICPNHAIFKNSYGGYVVDQAKCNACGMCEFTCPVNSIHIEDNVVKGICARCGLCEEACPDNARVDGYDLVESKQNKFIETLKIAMPKLAKSNIDLSSNIPSKPKNKKVAKRFSVNTDLDSCELCGRCSYYCPTGAIEVNIEQNGICTNCRVCEDLCPSGAIKGGLVDSSKCSLCLACLNNCPNNAITIDDFEINLVKLNQAMNGNIVSCLNCGLCAETIENGSLTKKASSLRYDPSLDEDTFKNREKRLIAIANCPTNTLNETQESKLAGLCVSCGKCIKVCDKQKARSIGEVTWDGEVSDDCISCGICAELCPEQAITLKRGSISVNLDECIMCETCAIHCPKDAIPKTTMVKKEIANGFNYIDDNLCISCGLCKNICPEEAISETDGKYSVDDEKCTYCGACKNICPANAFIFERNFNDIKNKEVRTFNNGLNASN